MWKWCSDWEALLAGVNCLGKRLGRYDVANLKRSLEILAKLKENATKLEESIEMEIERRKTI